MPWSEPIVHWSTGGDGIAEHRRLQAAGQLLTTWQPAPYESTATDCFRLGDAYWIWQPGVGGICFHDDRPECTAYPAADVDREWFHDLITRSWIPAVYLVWGRQVLHASAVAREGTGSVLAFVGPSGAGKSTLAYAMSRRGEWSQVSDDTLAFSMSGPDVALHPLRNDARLRPATAAYFGRADERPAPVVWPDARLRLAAIYLLEEGSAPAGAIGIEPVRAAEGYVRLLEQAHAFTLEIPSHNQRLMQDYLALAAAVPLFRLRYLRSFGAIEDVLDRLERHSRLRGD